MVGMRLRTWVLGIAMALMTSPLLACPFCEPTPTLRQDMADHVVVAIVELTGGIEATDDEVGTSVFTVKSLLKVYEIQPRVNDEITLPGGSRQPRGTRKLMMARRLGKTAVRLDWDRSFDIDDARLKYITDAPRDDASSTQQLAYFLKHLEHRDFFIGNDAFAEFTNVKFEDIFALRDQLPRDQLREWLFGMKTPAPRRGLYGMLLGLCGDQSDARLLEAKVLEPTQELRLGIDGMMGGYLWIKGEAALQKIDAAKFVSLNSSGAETEASRSETYSALQAIRFMWQYGSERISRDRLSQSMRLLLDRPEFAAVAITDLARWKDWSILDRVLDIALSETTEKQLQTAACKFVWQCSQDIPKSELKTAQSKHVERSRVGLLRIQAANPQLAQLIEDMHRSLQNAKAESTSKVQ